MGQGDPGSQHQSAVRQSKRSEAAKPAISGQCFRIGTHLVSFRVVSLPHLSHPKLAVRIGTSHSRQNRTFRGSLGKQGSRPQTP
jgi:hypothetical protein